ncbi:hypothetical protein GCM10010166_61240 [Couchioplanes caeruleus subsp. azureus]|nr:hypothetical protein GCM10010166_61240 [Couchioplanes caeruleus subsp. azureus]
MHSRLTGMFTCAGSWLTGLALTACLTAATAVAATATQPGSWGARLTTHQYAVERTKDISSAAARRHHWTKQVASSTPPGDHVQAHRVDLWARLAAISANDADQVTALTAASSGVRALGRAAFARERTPRPW